MAPALLLLLLPVLLEGAFEPEGDGEEELVGVEGEEASLLLVALKFWFAKTDSSWLLVKPDSGFLPLFFDARWDLLVIILICLGVGLFLEVTYLSL